MYIYARDVKSIGYFRYQKSNISNLKRFFYTRVQKNGSPYRVLYTLKNENLFVSVVFRSQTAAFLTRRERYIMVSCENLRCIIIYIICIVDLRNDTFTEFHYFTRIKQKNLLQ